MAAPDRKIIISRLMLLLNVASRYRAKNFFFAGDPEFETWRGDVVRWLENAGPYARGKAVSFSLISFNGQSGDLNKIWLAGLQKAEAILIAAIENLENDWSEPLTESAKSSSSVRNTQPAAPGIQIINQQTLEVNFRNTTVEQMLNGITDEVEKESPEKGGWLKKKIREILNDPVVKDYYGKTIEAVLKSKGG
jgi:hypothetical protein